MQCPIPLGAIAIKRELGPDVARRVDAEIRDSLRRSWAHPSECADFVRQNAQEMAPDVIQSHIDLYVNDYSLDADVNAVERLVELGERRGLYPASDLPIFAV
jgi:1,4-dihydroxy-6-naphthoate synthase